jgi:hypothetical protein
VNADCRTCGRPATHGLWQEPPWWDEIGDQPDLISDCPPDWEPDEAMCEPHAVSAYQQNTAYLYVAPLPPTDPRARWPVGAS